MAETDRTIPFYQTVRGCIIPGGFSAKIFEDSLKYVPRDDDFFIATYPKCGTTWVQQIVTLIYHKGEPCESLQDFVTYNPYMELLGRESAEVVARPAAIKIHLPFHLAPYSEKAKYLYVVRNPKDVAISYYHHAVTDPSFVFQEGTFDRFFEDYVSGKIVYNDYFDHVLGWYEHRNDSNVMFLTYEELKNDTKKSVLKIAKFMGETWYELLQNDEDVLGKVLKYSSLEFMRSLLNTNFAAGLPSDPELRKKIPAGYLHYLEFAASHSKETDEKFNIIRTGTVNKWKEVMSENQASRLDEKIEKRLKGTELYTFWKSIGCI